MQLSMHNQVSWIHIRWPNNDMFCLRRMCIHVTRVHAIVLYVCAFLFWFKFILAVPRMTIRNVTLCLLRAVQIVWKRKTGITCTLQHESSINDRLAPLPNFRTYSFSGTCFQDETIKWNSWRKITSSDISWSNIYSVVWVTQQ